LPTIYCSSVKKGGRRKAEGVSKKLGVKNFMLNFMLMKFSFDNEMAKYSSSAFFLPLPSAFRFSSF
jgi:hypothetical protein